MKEEEFFKALKEEKRKIVFIGDLNYLDLNNGYSFISSYTANSWLIEKKEKGEKIFDASKKGLILYYEDCLEIGLDLISNLYQKGMIGISDSEELFSDMFEFNISCDHCKNEKLP